MKIKLLFFAILITAATKTIAQGKFYIVPQVFAFVGSYKGVDSVNKKQTILKTRNFARKDFLVGINLSYYNAPFYYSLGIEQGAYSTSFYQKVDGFIRAKESYSALNVINYYFEIKYDLWEYNKRLPKKWISQNSENSYLIVSKISPYLGIDFLRTNKNIVDYGNPTLYGYQTGNTSVFNRGGELEFFSNSRNHYGIRTGFDWTFHNGDKRKFILTFGYKFGFRNLGYHRYTFKNSNQGVDFNYQTKTNGNGFSIKAGFPIKLYKIKKIKKNQEK